MILSFLFACVVAETTDTNEEINDTDTNEEINDTDTNEDTGSDEDPVDDAIIVNDGMWSLDTPTVEHDGCEAGNYQDLSEMVPVEIEISNGSVSSFMVDDGSCSVSGTDFVCSAEETSESTLAGTATLNISSTMSGTILSDSELDVYFDVVMESCEGIGCGAIELAMTFPCTIELSTTAMN